MSFMGLLNLGGKGDNERALTNKETELIRKVFQGAALPSLLDVSIADGLSAADTPWTDSDYQINVGRDLFEKDLAVEAPATLVHEMVHVWQYRNGTLTRAQALAAHAIYAFARRPDDIYDYNLGDSWESFGFEGQAQLVEDWFTPPDYQHPDGSNMGTHSLRFVYVDKVLRRGNGFARQLTLDELERPVPFVRPVPTAKLEGSVPIDVIILPLLKQRFRVNDLPGYRERANQLEKIFGGRMYVFDARTLLARLKTRKAGDHVSESFHDNLSSPFRKRLLTLLDR